MVYKLGVMLVLAVSVGCVPILHKDEENGTEKVFYHTFPMLKSPYCDNPENHGECPDEYFHILKKKNCEYNCTTSEQLICMNIGQHRMVFFCISKDTTCSKGIGWTIETADKFDVVVKESFCQKGLYQDKPSKCHNACENVHMSLGIMPAQFRIFAQGDHIYPAKLMCDYTKGFYNKNNKSFILYDKSFGFNYLDFCTHVNEFNPCTGGQMPLFNGTCVNICHPGYERDEKDYICKSLKDKLKENGLLSDDNSSPSFIEPAKNEETTTSEHSDHTTDNIGRKPIDEKGTGFRKAGFVVYLCVVAACLLTVFVPIALSIAHEKKKSCISPKNGDIDRSMRERKGEEFAKKHDNTLTQAVFDSLNAQMKYVGALVIDGVVGGTVFRVGTRYVMTAFHVIRKDMYDERTKQYYFQRIQSDRFYVNFNEAIGLIPSVRSQLKYCYHNEIFDVVVLEVCNVSGLPAKMLLYKGDSRLKYDKVSVIGYGNPEQQFKKTFDPLCEVVSKNGTQITSACRYYRKKKKHLKKFISDQKIVEDGYKGVDDEKNIIFHGYLEHGASGGPLLVCNDQRSVYVVGLLTHGIPESFYHLPDTERVKFSKDHRFHLACRMQLIYEDMKTVKRELAKDLFGETPTHN